MPHPSTRTQNTLFSSGEFLPNFLGSSGNVGKIGLIRDVLTFHLEKSIKIYQHEIFQMKRLKSKFYGIGFGIFIR